MPSPYTQYGAASGSRGALEQMIAERLQQEAVARQIAQQQIENEQKNRSLALADTQERRVGEYQKAQLEDLSLNREASRVNAIADDSMPGDVIDPATAALVTKHGRGGMLRTKVGTAAEGAIVPGAAPAPTTFDQFQAGQEPTGSLQTQTVTEGTPSQTVSRGGSKYIAGRQASQDRTDAQAAQAAAAKERADADRDMRLMIAKLGASNSAESRALANQLKEIQIKSEQEKLDTAVKTRTQTESAAKQSTETALDSVEKLLTHPGIDVATGAYEMRGFTQDAVDFNAERNMLVAALTLPNLGALKGPMSDKDIIFVKQLATKLQNPRLSKAETVNELNRAKMFLQEKMGTLGATAKRLTAKNPTTGEVVYSDDGGTTWHK